MKVVGGETLEAPAGMRRSIFRVGADAASECGLRLEDQPADLEETEGQYGVTGQRLVDKLHSRERMNVEDLGGGGGFPS